MEIIKIAKCNTKLVTYSAFDYEEVILHDTHLQHKAKCNCEVYDDDKGMDVEKHFDYDNIFLKRSIEQASVSYSNANEAYDVSISTSGQEDYTIAFFETMEDAIEVRDKILKWLLS